MILNGKSCIIKIVVAPSRHPILSYYTLKVINCCFSKEKKKKKKVINCCSK